MGKTFDNPEQLNYERICYFQENIAKQKFNSAQTYLTRARTTLGVSTTTVTTPASASRDLKGTIVR